MWGSGDISVITLRGRCCTAVRIDNGGSGKRFGTGRWVFQMLGGSRWSGGDISIVPLREGAIWS